MTISTVPVPANTDDLSLPLDSEQNVGTITVEHFNAVDVLTDVAASDNSKESTPTREIEPLVSPQNVTFEGLVESNAIDPSIFPVQFIPRGKPTPQSTSGPKPKPNGSR